MLNHTKIVTITVYYNKGVSHLYCIYCGHQLEEGQQVCLNCGKILVSSDERQISKENSKVYAGFWIRFTAYIIDSMILGMIGFGVGLFLGIASAVGSFKMPDLLATLLGSIIGWLYFAGLESSTNQATFGKMLLGIKVIDQTGNRISFARATARYFAKILSGITFCIGYIMVAFTNQKQALHDIIANTYVIPK